MNFQKTYTLESKALPGVVVTLRRIGPRKRSEVELSLSSVRAQQRELRMRMSAQSERYDKRLLQDEEVRTKMAELSSANSALTFGEMAKADLPEDVLAMTNALQETVDRLVGINTAQIQSAFIKAAIVSINEELTYDGQPATAELLCEYGPAELFDEVASIVNEGVYVSQEDAENLPSPTISGAQMDGPDSIAPSANSEACISPETAAGDTPKP